MKALEKKKKQPSKFVISSFYNIPKLLFINAQLVLSLKNHPLVIPLGFGFILSCVAHRTIDLEIIWENIKHVINHSCVVLENTLLLWMLVLFLTRQSLTAFECGGCNMTFEV